MATDCSVLRPQELPGRLWEGKEAVLEAVGSLAAACPQQLLAAGEAGGGEGPLAGRVVAALVDAAGKKKSGYRKAALEQLEAGWWAGGRGKREDFRLPRPFSNKSAEEARSRYHAW